MNFKIIFYILFHLLKIISTKKLLNKQKKIINLSYAINNKYIDIIYISLVSLFENSDNNTIYNIYVLSGEDFEQKNKLILKKLETLYFNCFIIIMNLGNAFENVYKSFLDITTYYRLKLPEICLNINRIIYIDSDTIILKDLLELYTLNFNRNYILAKLDIYPNELDKFGIFIKNNINAGVLLIDLYSLRKYNYVEKFMEYIKVHNNDKKYLNAHDQTLINYIMHDKIGIFKPKYHMWPYKNVEEFMTGHRRVRIPYNISDVREGFNDTFIVHFPGSSKYKESKKDIGFYKNYYKYLQMVKQIMEVYRTNLK